MRGFRCVLEGRGGKGEGCKGANAQVGCVEQKKKKPKQTENKLNLETQTGVRAPTDGVTCLTTRWSNL